MWDKLADLQYNAKQQKKINWSSCDTCISAIDLFGELIELNFTLEAMEYPATKFCETFVFPHEEHRICAGLIHVYTPSIVYVLKNTLFASSELCTLLHVCLLDNYYVLT